MESVKTPDEIQHPAVNAALRILISKKDWKFITMAICRPEPVSAPVLLLPSASFTPCTLLKGKIVSKRQLALEAIHLEQEVLKENVGCQDQVVAAFGGFNKIEFGGPSKITVCPMPMSPERLNLFQDHLMLFLHGVFVDRFGNSG